MLVDFEIHTLCQQGLVKPYIAGNVGSASLDVTLGDTIMVEQFWSPELKPVPIAEYSKARPYLLRPKRFILAETVETFCLPDNISGQFSLTSTLARQGLEHLLAGFCWPGWRGSQLTLELTNVRRWHSVPLWPGMVIGQIVLTQLLFEPHYPYSTKGRYNHDCGVRAAKIL